MRNEKILQLIAYYFSIDGNIIYLHSKLTEMDSKIDELFSLYVLNNIYMIIYDKNLTPTQMVNNFMNFNDDKWEERAQTKENEINDLKDYIQQLTEKKEEAHNEFISFCKDKYEIKNKYFFNKRNKSDNSDDFTININTNKNYAEEYNKEKETSNEMIVERNIDSIEDENLISEIINKKYKHGIGNDLGVQTRKKKKINYFDDSKRKNVKKFIRKNKSLALRNTNKYYLDNNK